MTPTRTRDLAVTVAVAAVVGYLLVLSLYAMVMCRKMPRETFEWSELTTALRTPQVARICVTPTRHQPPPSL